MYTICSFGTWIPGRYIYRGGLYSGVAVKRGSTVILISITVMPIILIHVHTFIAQSHVCTLTVVLTGMGSMPEPVESHDVHV